jgi:hypothetical protein
MYARDSAMITDCTAGFFQRSVKPSKQKIRLVNKAGKLVSMNSFLTTNHIETNEVGVFSDYGLLDLDNDGKNELVISNFTGGAHCCDEIYIFRNIGPDKYQYVVKLYAGDACINPENVFSYRFYQQFGYFFTCFACAYTDTSDAAPIPLAGIELKYAKGKLSVVPGNQELRSIINDNLGKLSEQPYVALDDIAIDEGLRKEFAMNLVVYYYSFGRNLAQTQQLFNKYYKFPDAKKIWAEFARQLQGIRKSSDF